MDFSAAPSPIQFHVDTQSSRTMGENNSKTNEKIFKRNKRSKKDVSFRKKSCLVNLLKKKNICQGYKNEKSRENNLMECPVVVCEGRLESSRQLSLVSAMEDNVSLRVPF